MLLGNTKAYGAVLTGTTPDHSGPGTWKLFASGSELALQVNVSYLSSASDVAIALEASFDGINWIEVYSKSVSPTVGELSTAMLSVDASALSPAGPLRRLRLALVQAGVSAHVDVWIALRAAIRDPNRRTWLLNVHRAHSAILGIPGVNQKTAAATTKKLTRRPLSPTELDKAVRRHLRLCHAADPSGCSAMNTRVPLACYLDEAPFDNGRYAEYVIHA